MRRAVVALLALALAPAAHAGIRVSVSPPSVGVGDPFRYTVEATAGGEVRVVADTGAFEQVAAPQVSRSTHDGVTTVRLVQTLACLDRGCAPDAKPRRVTLPAPRTGAATGPPAAVTVVPRVPASAVSAPAARYRATTAVPGPPSPLGPAAAVAIALAAACALGAAWLLVRRPQPLAGAPALGLPEALRLLRQSAARPAADRRRASDLVARLVRERGREDEAADATRVAWAPPEPDAGDVVSLADRVEGSA